jgi:hypothetical protein
MDNYEQDIFYETKVLDLEQKKDLLRFAMKNSKSWNVDILDARKSWQRESIEMSFDDILAKLDDDCHFVFIHRRGFKTSSGKPLSNCEYAIETGFCTMRGDPAYYLFIFCDEKKLSKFITKYHLEKHIQ